MRNRVSQTPCRLHATLDSSIGWIMSKQRIDTPRSENTPSKKVSGDRHAPKSEQGFSDAVQSISDIYKQLIALKNAGQLSDDDVAELLQFVSESEVGSFRDASGKTSVSFYHPTGNKDLYKYAHVDLNEKIQAIIKRRSGLKHPTTETSKKVDSAAAERRQERLDALMATLPARSVL